MAVKFCFAGGYFQKLFDYGMEDFSSSETHRKEEIPEKTNVTAVRLGDLGPLEYKTYTSAQMRARLTVAMSFSDEIEAIWRTRIICILGLFKSVVCINFIPADPHLSQILHVIRMNDLEESVDSDLVYGCDFSHYKFILPKADPDQVLDLSRWDFCHLDPTVEAKDSTRGISMALYCLKKEKTLKGMALTLQGAQGELKTYVWIKPTYGKHRGPRPECHLADLHMAVKFCYVGGYFHAPVTGSMEELFVPTTYGDGEIPEKVKYIPFQLSESGCVKYRMYSPEELKDRIIGSKGLPKETKDLWRYRIICVLAPVEAVFCISFIPYDSNQQQVFQVMRMKNLEEEAASYPLYCHNHPPYIFILPKEHPDKVFDLSKWDFSLNPKSAIVRALKCLKREKTLKGMALTLQGAEGDFKTFVWMKPTYKKYRGLRP
jgi:hypothetical protein